MHAHVFVLIVMLCMFHVVLNVAYFEIVEAARAKMLFKYIILYQHDSCMNTNINHNII